MIAQQKQVDAEPAFGEDEREAVTRLLRKLSTEHFFGEVTLGVQSGKICTVRCSRTYKIVDLME